MDEKNQLSVPTAPAPERDQALFDAIGKDKKRKKRRRWIITTVILALLAGGITAGVIYGRKKVKEEFGGMAGTRQNIVAYEVDDGSVTTTVTGSGLLTDVDTVKLTMPEGVEIDKLLVGVGDKVDEGQPLASVEISSVLGTMTETQSKLDELDGKLRSASGETVSNVIRTGVAGRVKTVYAQVGTDVASCVVDNGALAILSLDGLMAVDLDTDALTEGEEVTVVLADGRELKGTAEKVLPGTATVTLTDNGPAPDEEVAVLAADGTVIGSGRLYVHNPLRIMGYAGTVSTVYARENALVYANNMLFQLQDTAYSANYEAVLRQRRETEEKLLKLLEIYRSGTIDAPFAGTVSSVEYKENASSGSGTASGGSTGTDYSGYGAYDSFSSYGSYGTGSGNGSGNGNDANNTVDKTALVTLSRDEQMNVRITVDEVDIMSLEVGQEAQVTINSIGEMFSGTVTEIIREATGEAGVTSYAAVITMPKDPRMLPGMSARVVVRIQGVAGAILIPEAALHQTRDAAFVYTQYDYDTETFGGAVPVISGLSDGNMVEIVEGLAKGDMVYYTEVFDPYAYWYGSDGDASGGNAWVEPYASDGDVYYASEGDAVYASEGDAPASDRNA